MKENSSLTTTTTTNVLTLSNAGGWGGGWGREKKEAAKQTHSIKVSRVQAAIVSDDNLFRFSGSS